jgi:hypothetical protein
MPDTFAKSCVYKPHFSSLNKRLRVIAIIGLYFFYKRLKNQDIQRVDDRFHSAINLLGSSETSARTGAVYVLHELAIMANLPQTEFPFNLPRQSSNFFFTTVPPPYQKYQLL